LPELAGGVALAATAPALVLLGGWTWLAALGLALLLGARVCTSVLYVRARLRAARGLRDGRTLALTSHAMGLLLALGLTLAGVVPGVAALAFVLLLARTLHGLLLAPAQVRPQVVGFQELAYGALFTLLLALGYVAHHG
jgi:hypothetical protein